MDRSAGVGEGARPAARALAAWPARDALGAPRSALQLSLWRRWTHRVPLLPLRRGTLTTHRGVGIFRGGGGARLGGHRPAVRLALSLGSRALRDAPLGVGDTTRGSELPALHA